ncbi:glycoside hydrolase family 76 protein [Moniliophthora roreri MCA 2997]|uniref:Glycoside hydrolase family 76 protein n=1 Tax=Moniliophthora roreri (strain MCA 2997) TaxID=1381753 RepID=V2XR23_MONRO|nr:glycoside hydrolase family 76 protein [Moniliophthora roreri MCA 2997]
MLSCFLLCILAPFIVHLAIAQSLVPSPDWRKPNITIQTQDRVGIANAALNVAINKLEQDLTYCAAEGGGYGLKGAARLHMQLSVLDDMANTTTYQDQVRKYFELRGDGSGNLTAPEQVLYLISCRAYMTYGDDYLLRIAENIWARANNETITNTTSLPLNICDAQRSRLMGGIFSLGSEQPITFLGNDNGLFFVISALLAELTSNSTYLDAALRTASFIRTNMHRTPGIVQGVVVKDNCSNAQFSDNLPRGQDETGMMIQGLVVLDSIQRHTNSSIMDEIRQAVSASGAQIGPASWLRQDEVMLPNAGYLAHALGFVYERIPSNMTELKSYLQSFIGVQFNAILDQATSFEHENLYGNWIGPPSTVFHSSNQTSACQGLIAAISIPQATVENAAPFPKVPGSKASSTPVGAIAGGVVGGVAIVAIAGICIFYYRRRQRRSEDGGTATTPFTTQASTIGNISKGKRRAVSSHSGDSQPLPGSGSSSAQDDVPPPAYEA